MFSKLLCLTEVAHILQVMGEGGTLPWYVPPTGLIFKSSRCEVVISGILTSGVFLELHEGIHFWEVF